MDAVVVDNDYFMERGGERFAGLHLIADFYEAHNLTSLTEIEEVLRNAAKIAGATVLSASLHPFPGGGIAGVIVLAESHISIHTWPERGYAALDIFMCGNTQPEVAVEFAKAYFRPDRIKCMEIPRGRHCKPPQ